MKKLHRKRETNFMKSTCIRKYGFVIDFDLQVSQLCIVVAVLGPVHATRSW